MAEDTRPKVVGEDGDQLPGSFHPYPIVCHEDDLCHKLQEVEQYKRELREQGKRVIALEKEVVEQRRASKRLQRQVALLSAERRIQNEEDSSTIWPISDVRLHHRLSHADPAHYIQSEPFYSGRNGYKMCLRAYINGVGTGRNTHLSMELILLRGDHDQLLPWPFRQKVTLKLLDQDHEGDHIVTGVPTWEGCLLDQTTDGKHGRGCEFHTFYPLLALLDPKSSHCRNDVIYIKCYVAPMAL